MKKVVIDQNFFEVFPESKIYLLHLKGINNQINEADDPFFAKMLAEASQSAQKFFVEETFSENSVVKVWREAFSKFKTKKGARSSIENLLKRAAQGRTFSPINPLVDIYNSVSLEFALPCGGEDLAKIDGDLHLGKAQGGESFLPLGETEDSPALPEEIIYYDNSGAICRCLNWREAQRTMLTPETQNAILVIETINSEQQARAEQAIEKLRMRAKDFFGVDGEKFELSKENPSVEIA
ncbi:MAG: phenylalanine--tRNA ligase beta subunit-related protein [bacterium]|nr:phenylalanine--tRNA ligase beta subunit-related protein [bacterium]